MSMADNRWYAKTYSPTKWFNFRSDVSKHSNIKTQWSLGGADIEELLPKVIYSNKLYIILR